MKRFRFGLEKVLKVKQQRERIAEAQLAQARLVLDAAHERVQQVSAEVASVAATLESRIGQVLQAELWAATFDHANQLARALHEAESAVVVAQKSFDDAAQTRRVIATEVEALKNLRQQKWQEHRAESGKLEQDRLDELGMRRWSGNTEA